MKIVLCKSHSEHWFFQGNLNYGKQGPIAASATYKLSENGKQKKVDGNAALLYGQGKNFKVSGSATRQDENQYTVEVELQTPFENYRNSKLSVQTKRSPDQNHINSNLQLITDGKQLSLNTELILSDISPLVNLQLKTFDGKLTQFYLKTNKVSDKEFDGAAKVIYEANNFLLEGNWNVNIDNIQDFLVKANVNSPSLKLNKLSLEAQSKPGKGDRRIQINIKSAGKNWLSGTTTYQTREDQDKFVAEGSGSFKIKDESVSGNFKFNSQQLSIEKNGEQGIDISLDINLGKRTFDGEFKLSDKQFRLLNAYCDKAKDCLKIEINSKTAHNGKCVETLLIQFFVYFI